ncbi:MAG TPA: VWA domain-containing protein [Blastocatellia bacterium]|nr:VWA domain-containing protein [Blastocatellia bacterium]
MKLDHSFAASAGLIVTRLRLLLPGVFLICCCAVTAAQETEKSETLKIETTLVSVPVIVSDSQGRYVPGLQAADFALYENRLKQQVDFFAAVEEPLNVALLLDTSFSARNVLDDIRDAARDFIRQLRPQDRAMVVSFDWRVNTLSPLTGDRKALERAVKEARIGEQLGTVLRAAVDQVLRGEFKSLKGRKAIILLTDGKDAGSRIGPQPLLETVTEADTLIYTVFYTTGLSQERERMRMGRRGGVLASSPEQRERRERRERRVEARNEVAVDFLQALAEASAGRYYRSEVTNLKKTFGLIADELRHQYRLGFYPPDHPPGSTHSLRVEVARPGLVVRARRSYRVVEQQ